MEGQLQDQSTYQKLDYNPLEEQRKKTKAITLRWNDNGYFHKKYHPHKFTQSDTVMTRLYGLVKVHKFDTDLTGQLILQYDDNDKLICKFRPVLSAVNTPPHFIANFLNSVLNNSIKKPASYVKNSHQFIQDIYNIHVPDNHVLISLDASSLFTNVPYDLVKLGIDKQYEQIKKHTIIPLHEIHEAIDYFENNTYLQFNNTYYKQIFGTPMGSPISPIFADIVLADLEEYCLSLLDYKPVFYKRYFDDILTCVPIDKIHYTLGIFNSYNPRLQFTHEIESNNNINFLDLTVIRNNNSLMHNWFRKPSNSNRFLNYNSNHTKSQKIGMVYNLVDRAILLANDCYHNENLDITKKLLLQNQYPLKFINFYTKKRLNTIKYRNNASSGIDDNNHSYSIDFRKNLISKMPKVCIPFVGKMYDNISRMLRKYNINTIPKIANQLGSIIIKGKDKIPKEIQTNVVYRFNCKDCDVSYVGTSKREAIIRISEHQKGITSFINKEEKENAIKNAFQNVRVSQRMRDKNPDYRKDEVPNYKSKDEANDTNDSQIGNKYPVVTKHFIDTRHEFNFKDFELLDIEPFFHKRSVSEMFHIKLQPNAINEIKDTQKLFPSYGSVIHKLKSM